MGSEDSIPISEEGVHSSLPAFTNKASDKIATNNDYELLIAIRGQRNTGKSCLIQRMQGKPFSNDYVPTQMLSAAEFVWTSPKQEKVRITAWDVVEHALLPNDIDEKIEYPDATTVDTYKRTDGIVLMIDSRYPDTVKLATSILRDAPSQIPIVIFSNFQDTNDAVPTIPKELKRFTDRFSFIVGSMKSNLGLTDLNEWISLPLAKSKSTLYLNKYHSLMEELNRRIIDFTTTAEYYVDFETARQRIPKPALIGHQNNTQNTQSSAQPQQNQGQNKPQRRSSEAINDNDENGFWSDDDEDAINHRIQQKINQNKLKNTEKKDDDIFVSNPMVKRRVVKKSSSQNLPNQTPQENPENVPEDKGTKQTQNKTQLQIKSDMIKIEGNVDDDFFNDDEEEEQKIPENVNLKVLDEDDDEPLRPNPLVESIKSKKSTNQQVQPKRQDKEETTTSNEPEKKETKDVKKQIIPTIKVESGNNDNDGFFDDDDDNEENELDAKIVTSNNDDSDEELKPNPLVSSKPVPRVAPKVTAQKTIAPKPVTELQEEPEKESKNEPATEPEKKESYVNPVSIPTIQTEELGGNENNGFFDDDEDNDEKEAKADTLNNEDDDEEELKPNPLVSSNSAPKPTAVQNEPPKEPENNQNEEKTVSIPTIQAEELGGNENDAFFDDDKDEDENVEKADILNKNDDDDEELKPNPLVSTKTAPNLAKLPSSSNALPTETQNEPEKEAENKPEPQLKKNETEEKTVSIPTIQADELGGNENDAFFDDDDENENESKAETLNNNDDEEEELKPNPLVSSKSAPTTTTKAEIDETENCLQQESQPEKEEAPQHQEPSNQIKLPTIDAGEVDNDFFNDDDDENKENTGQKEAESQPESNLVENDKKESENLTENVNNDSTQPETEEKVDDGFFDDEDDNDTNQDLNINSNVNNGDDDDDEPVKPNPLVASKIKSKLQDSIVKQERILQTKQQQEQNQEQTEVQGQSISPVLPDVSQNAEVDDFFNDDDQEPTQNNLASSSADYADLGNGYDEINNETEAASSSSYSAIKKPRKKKVIKRKKHQEEQAQNEPTPSPEVSGDYESI